MQRPHTLVIGGTRGIGRAVVKMFAARKHAVSTIGRRDQGHGTRRSRNVRFWQLDLTDSERLPVILDEIVEANGRLTNLVLLQRYRDGGDTWSGEWSVSVTASKAIIEHLAPKGFVAGEGSIVIVGSNASRFIAREQPIGYHTAKAALIQLMRYYALVLGPQGLRVNCVTPGTVLKAESKDFYLNNKPLLRLYRKITPLGRMGSAEDIANAIEFLCSPNSSFITGQDIVVDGGVSLEWQEGLARTLTRMRLSRDANKDSFRKK